MQRVFEIAWGVFAVGAGGWALVRPRQIAEQGANFHRMVATVLPWLYKIGTARMATSTRAWRVVTPIIGSILIVVGVLAIVDGASRL
ncbi:MAG: hypothetical protein WD770_06545 [Actinomycetota bacterium]